MTVDLGTRSPLRPFARPLLVGLALVALAACGDDDSAGGTTTTAGAAADAVTEVGYAFHDASLPPEYHRSWTVTVTEGQAYIVVDSYGDVVGEDTAEVDASTWEQVRDAVAALEGDDPGEGESCEGGTGAEVWATEGDEPRFEMDVSVCGGNSSDVADRWRAAVEPVTELFDMQALLATE